MSDDDFEPITQVSAVNNTKKTPMPKDLEAMVVNFTPLQKRYADYRAKGMKQADAALKAGSKGSGRAALGRIGYGFEQLEGMKEYITYLYEQRAKASVLDEIEIIEKLRANYDEAFQNGRIDHANKAVELMCLIIGAFAKDGGTKSKPDPKSTTQQKNTEAFKSLDNAEDTSSKDRLKAISTLMKTVNLDE